MAELAVAESPRPRVPVGLPPGDPTFDGFKWFVQNVMGVIDEAMPTDDWLQIVYDEAINMTYYGLATVPSQPTTPSIYALAVYNLGCALLLEIAQDNPNSTYWQDLRQSMGINSFSPGLINAAHDQGTGEGMVIPPYLLNGLTLWSLQLLKSPWGRAFLMFSGQWGSLWGITF